jgi:general secretion pathway protein F
LEASERLFPPLFRAAVRAGESSARLPDAFGRFAQYLEVMARLRQSVVSAAIYPLFVAGFGVLVLLFLLGYVVPRFAVAYEALPDGAGAPGLLLSTARFVAEQFQLVLLAGIAALWGLWRWFADPRHRASLISRLLRIGPIADTVRAFHFARLYRSLSMMLDGGYTVPAALKLAMEVLRGTPWLDPLEKVAQRVDAGKALGESLAEGGFTNEITSRLVIAGDRSAQLAAMFDFAAEHYERELALRVERAARVLEPALLIVVAGAIGLIVLLMYMPIFDLATALG